MAGVKGKFQCEWCKKSFALEQTLTTHSCVIRNRWEMKGDAVAEHGFRLFARHYKTQLGMRKARTWEDFARSDLFSDFLRFAKYCRDTKVPDSASFSDYLFELKIPPHKWADDKYYVEWHNEYVMTEDWKSALTRSLEFVVKWSEKHDKKPGSFFTEAGDNDLSYWIMIGSISPWMYLLCDSGKARLGELLEKPAYADRILEVLMPRYWEERFEACPELETVQGILQESGL